MTDVALYPGARRSGKTTMLLRQVRQAAAVGQSVAVMCPSFQQCQRTRRQVREMHVDLNKVHFVTESTLDTLRGCRLDHLFVDDADCFVEPPAELLARYQPGVPFTMTYTPNTWTLADIDYYAESERSRRVQQQKREAAYWADLFMMGYINMKMREYDNEF